MRALHRFILAAALLLPTPRALPAGESPTALPDVLVSATRSAQSNVTVPASITIISREEIARSGARNLAEVLRGRGSVQVIDSFGDGSRTTVGMRGFGESANANTLIMVDGRRLNNIDISDPDLNSISLKDVERVEIIHGSAGTLFGDQAVGGVINVITRTPERLQAFGEARRGSYDAYELRSGVTQRLENGFSYRASIEKRESENYRNSNELDYENYLGRLGFEHSSGSAFAELQHVREDLGTPGALFAEELAANRRQAAPGQEANFSDTETTVARIGGQQALGENWSLEAELTNRESESEFLLGFRTLPATDTNLQNRHLTSFNPRLVGAYPTRNGDILITLGHDVEWADYEIRSVLGGQRNDQRTRGTYGQAVVPILPGTSLTFGARHLEVENDLLDDGPFASFPAGRDIDDRKFVTEAGLSFRPDERWRMFVRRDENVRFVKVDEFLFTTPGVPLKTQTGESYEAGVEWADGGHRAKALVYWLDLDDEIAFDPSAGPFGFGANVNLESTRRKGVILEAAWQATARLRLAGTYSYIDARVRSGALKGNRVPLVARHVGFASVDYRLTPSWRVHAEVHGVSERVFSGDFDKVLGELPGYGVVNLLSEVRRGGWTFSVRVNNLLDNEYSDSGARSFDPITFAPVESFFPSPERNFWLSVRYDYE